VVIACPRTIKPIFPGITKIESETQIEFAPSSHLVVKYGFYDHHGIYCGDGKVIHFGRGVFDLENAVVECVDLEIFCNGNPIHRCHSETVFEHAEIIDRARKRLGESGYDLFENNCEHFVNWCRNGGHESHQVNLSESVVRQTAAVATKPLLRKWAVKAASGRLGASTIGLARGPAIVAAVADAVQATVEIVAVRNGKTKYETRQLGQRVGLASSATVGWALGGPVTAAAGMGYWLMGQIIANLAVDSGKLAISSAMEQSTSSEFSPTSSDA
jgi:hypothetical protein